MPRSTAIALSALLLLGTAATRAHAQTGVTIAGIEFPDGSVQNSAAARPANEIQVAESGAPFLSIQSAVASILDADADNPYVVLVGPGVYNEQVTMKPHVDIEGAGTSLVVITSPGGGTDAPTLWTAADAELREVTVRSTDQAGLDSVAIRCASKGRLREVRVEASKSAAGGVADARGIYGFPCEELVLWRVTVESSGSAGLNSGLFINNQLINPDPTLQVHESEFMAFGSGANSASAINAQGSVIVVDSSLTAKDAANVNSGFYLGNQHDSQVQLEGVTITAGAGGAGSGIGVWMETHTSNSSEIRIDRSSISGADESVDTRDGVSVFIGASRLEGAVDTSSGGSAKCVVSYDESYEPLAEDCAPVVP